MSTLTGILTKHLESYVEVARARAIAAEATCEDGQEPLASLDQELRLLKSMASMSAHMDKVLQVAIDCVKAIPDLDTSAHSALGDKYRTPRQSAEFTLYELARMNYLDATEVATVMNKVPTNPSTLVMTGKLEA
jgi:hypothetical protein